MFKGFSYFFAKKTNKVLIILVVAFLVIASILYIIAGKRAENSLVEQTLHREQVIVRAAAKSIKSFLQLAGKSLAILAANPNIVQPGDETQSTLNDFISEWEDTPFVEVILTDKKGEVKFLANRTNSSFTPGVSVKDRDYFIASQKAKRGEIFVGEPILPRLGEFQGQYIVSIATPVYKDGEFQGVLAGGVLLSDLTNAYIEPLRISKDTEVYLTDSEGLLLHSPRSQFQNVNILDYIRKNPFPGSREFLEEMTKAKEKDEGKLDILWPDVVEKSFQRNLVAYSKIKIHQKDWFLIIATPVKDALMFFAPFQINQTIAFLLGVSIVLAFSALYILMARHAENQGFLDGFTQGVNHVKGSKKRKKE